MGELKPKKSKTRKRNKSINRNYFNESYKQRHIGKIERKNILGQI